MGNEPRRAFSGRVKEETFRFLCANNSEIREKINRGDKFTRCAAIRGTTEEKEVHKS
jgi:hypothetical protein